MSSRIPMYALDKVRLSVNVPAELYVKLETRSKECGRSMACLFNEMLAGELYNDPWSEEQQHRMDEIVAKNAEDRAKMKTQKGIH